MFFVSYLIFEVPANMILTRVRPSVFLPALALIWGTFASLMGATQNWRQLAAMRFLLGIAEVRGEETPSLKLCLIISTGWFRSRVCFLPFFMVSAI